MGTCDFDEPYSVDSGDSDSGDGDDDDDNDEVVEDEETCTNKADKTNKFNYNGKKKSCKWVRNKIEQRCKQESLRKKCRTTCNYNGCDMTNSNSNEDNEDEEDDKEGGEEEEEEQQQQQ